MRDPLGIDSQASAGVTNSRPRRSHPARSIGQSLSDSPALVGGLVCGCVGCEEDGREVLEESQGGAALSPRPRRQRQNVRAATASKPNDGHPMRKPASCCWGWRLRRPSSVQK
jgi:hypothetical protein